MSREDKIRKVNNRNVKRVARGRLDMTRSAALAEKLVRSIRRKERPFYGRCKNGFMVYQSVAFQPELLHVLKFLAKGEGISTNAYIRKACLEYYKKHRPPYVHLWGMSMCTGLRRGEK